jgi:hypothetical protein
VKFRECCFWSLVFTAILLAPVVTTADYYWGAGQDLVLQHHPLRQAGYEALRAGEWPLWNPYMGTGLPYQTGLRTLAYPLHVLGLWLDAGQQIKVSIFFHLFLAISLMTAMLNWMGLSRPSCLTGGLTYGGSGFFFGHLFAGHIDWVEPVAYLPGVIWAALVAFRQSGIGWTVLAGTALGWMALAGHYQPIYIALVGVLSLQLLLCLTGSRFACQSLSLADPWACRPEDRTRESEPWTLSDFGVDWAPRRRDLLGLLQRVLVIGVSSLGLALFRLLPSVESLMASNRLSSAEDFSGSAPALQTLYTYLIPHFFEGSETILCWSAWPSWEAQGYLGIAALGLASVAFLGKRREWFAPACMAMFCFLMSVGANTPLYSVWKAFDPLLQNFRAPGRFALILTFFVGWLAALGWELLIRQRVPRAAAAKASLVITIPVLALTVWLFSQGPAMRGWAHLVHSAASPEAWDYVRQQHADNLPGLLAANQTGALVSLTIAAAMTLVIATVGARASALAVLIVLIDLALFASPYLKTAPPSAFELPRGVTTYLSSFPEARVLWEPNLNWFGRFSMLSLAEASAYDYFLAPAYVQAVNAQQGAPLDRPMTLVSDGDGGGLWQVLGVQHIVRRTPLNSAGYRLEKNLDGWLIYRAVSALPRAFVVGKSVVLPDREVFQLAVTDPTVFASTAFLAPGQPSLTQPLDTPGYFAPASRVRLGFNSVVVEVAPEQPGLLVLNDSPWPGWWVTVDGRTADLLRLNGGLHRGVELSAGPHRVEFSYWPRPLTWGILGSLLSALLCLLLARPWQLFRRFDRFRSPVPGQSADSLSAASP